MNDRGLGGSGGLGGGGGGAGGELVGVAQEADTCCCPQSVNGSPVQCSVPPNGQCPPYTAQMDGACGSTSGGGTETGCSASGVRSGAGGVDAMEVFVILLALAALGAMRRRFA